MATASKEKSLKENTFESLSKAIQLSDGIEFDVRTTSDEGLILHHDKTLSVSKRLQKELPDYVELNQKSELTKLGFSSFEDVIQDSVISQGLRDNGKVACIELKLPHPSSGVGAGWFNSRANIPYVEKMLNQCAEVLIEAEIPKHSVIFYGFFKHMSYVAKKIKFNWEVTSLFPNQLRAGSRRINRIYAAPQFILKSIKSMIKLQKNRKSPMLPCSLEYFISPTNKLRLDRTYGLSGKPSENLLKLRQGFPIYVWPGLIKDESKLYNAGITSLTDDLDPHLVTLPEGIVRWTRPSTQPLDIEWRTKFMNTDVENHANLIKEATMSVSPWHETNKSERKAFLDEWKKRWYWGRSYNSIYDDSASNKLPWEAVRIVGHRGSGITSRPIFY